jgi:nitroimidazol reductase NimA-like FMN-containing flavoprotein (pyridoxamine 5'-phosphate oxidase superfamily)
MREPPPSSRARVRRLPERAAYERETIHAILDEGLVCHVGIEVDGQPYVLPMNHGRDGNRLLLHGSAASRLMQGLAAGQPACFTVTLVDGLVLARSAFHHSMNFRSVVLLGRARPIADPAGKSAALRVISERLVPGRWDAVRPPAARELAMTSVVEVPLDEASAKIRMGPPKDDPEDLALPVWAGVLPLSITPGDPVPDGVEGGVEVPPCIREWRQGKKRDSPG